MSLTLYFAPGACSFVPHVMLQAAGAPFEARLVKLHRGEQRAEPFLSINPEGQVPVLMDGTTRVRQILAICLYLDQKFPAQHFLPADPAARILAIERLAWFNNTVHATFSHVFMPGKYSPDETAQASVRATALARYKDLLQAVQALTEGAAPFIDGAHIGPNDAYAMTVLRWATLVGIDPAETPALWAYCQRMAEQPAVRATLEAERIPLSHLKPA